MAETTRRGRPPGSPSLTADRHRDICALVAGGATISEAAEIVGLSSRAVYDWLERGAGRSSKACRKNHRDLFLGVRKAKAEARAGARVRTLEKFPTKWLDLDDKDEATPATAYVSVEEATGLAINLVESMLEAGYQLKPCGEPSCPCRFHGGEADA